VLARIAEENQMLSEQTGHKLRMAASLIVIAILWVPVAAAGVNEDLIEAAKHNDIAAVQSLLAKGADANAKDGDGATALIWASENGHLEVVQVLLAKGAKVNAQNNGGVNGGVTALIQASQNGYHEVVKALLAEGAEVNTQRDDGFTALIIASQEGHIAVVQALLDKGADVNAKESHGWTALMQASQGGPQRVVQLLLGKGADVNAKDGNGASALMRASAKGQIAVVQLLLAKRADVNASRNDGTTALMQASFNGHLEVVQALLANSADVNAKESHGWTALAAAKDPRVRALLVQAGAKQDHVLAADAQNTPAGGGMADVKANSISITDGGQGEREYGTFSARITPTGGLGDPVMTPPTIYIFRNLPQEARRFGVKVGSAYRWNGNAFVYVRAVDLKLDDKALCAQFGIHDDSSWGKTFWTAPNSGARKGK
jgi:ankyrin repeat protein